jgi:hypothetical protein
LSSSIQEGLFEVVDLALQFLFRFLSLLRLPGIGTLLGFSENSTGLFSGEVPYRFAVGCGFEQLQRGGALPAAGRTSPGVRLHINRLVIGVPTKWTSKFLGSGHVSISTNI